MYCGISNDLKSRLIQHNSGKGAKYLRSRRPVDLVGVSSEMTKSEALKLEYKIKQLPADKKLAQLLRKENGMTISKRDLQALNKDIKAIEIKIEKLIAAVEKSEKPKSAKKPGRKGEDRKGGTKKKGLPELRVSAKKAFQDKNYEEGLKFLNEILRLEPEDDTALTNKGMALSRLGKYDEALKSYDHAIRIDHSTDQKWFGRGMTQYKLDRYDEALGSFYNALACNPENEKAEARFVIVPAFRNHWDRPRDEETS